MLKVEYKSSNSLTISQKFCDLVIHNKKSV